MPAFCCFTKVSMKKQEKPQVEKTSQEPTLEQEIIPETLKIQLFFEQLKSLTNLCLSVTAGILVAYQVDIVPQNMVVKVGIAVLFFTSALAFQTQQLLVSDIRLKGKVSKLVDQAHKMVVLLLGLAMGLLLMSIIVR